MQQNHFACDAIAQHRAVEPEIRGTFGRISEHLTGKHAVAHDRVQRAIDPMMHVIEPGRRALAHALAVIPMPPAARETRDQRRAQQPLRVDHRLMRLFAHGTPERAELPPCRRRERRRPPAPRGDRDDAVDRAMQPHQRREGFLHHPADARLRPVPARIAHRRHVMDHIAERGGLDEQDIGHQAGDRTTRRKPDNRFFIEMRVGTGRESR